MSHLLTKNNFTLEIKQRLEQSLPELDVKSVLSEKEINDDLRCYLDAYGFFKTPAASKARYTLGHVLSGNYNFICHYWSQENACGTIFLAHGLFDHMGIYLYAVDQFIQQGYNVIGIDFPGHGLSKGEVAAIEHFSDYGKIIDDVLSLFSNEITKPLYGVGQSTGCAALLNYHLVTNVNKRNKINEGNEFSKLVLLAPLVQPKSWFSVNLAYLLLNKFMRVVPRSFSINSHDKDFCVFLKDYDALQSRQISVKWIGAMRQWVKIFDSLPQSDISTLIIQGDNDGAVEWKKNIPRIQAKLTSSKLFMLPSAMHHLVNESDALRGNVFEEMFRFLKS